MAEHKICKLCKQSLICLANDIQNCHCFQVKLTAEAKRKLQLKAADCICGDCLKKFATPQL